MIQKTLRELAKQIFWLFAIILGLTLPMVLFVAPVLEENSRIGESGATPVEIYAMAALVGFTLIIVGIFIFRIFPALIELGEAIWKARKDANEEMFP